MIDTPGLTDEDIISNDLKVLNEIKTTISEEKIQIKGIFFLVHFQMERFDESEQKALLIYHKIFHFKKFWKHLIVIYTHDYGDLFEEEKEEVLRLRIKSHNNVLARLMEIVKNVSDVIDCKEVITKYYNLYSPVKIERQRIVNNKNKEDLEISINDFCQKEPLSC